MIRAYHIETSFVESYFNEMIEDVNYLKFASMFTKINEYRKTKTKRKVR